MKLSIAALLVVLVGANMLCAEEPETFSGPLGGQFRVIEPVGIDMPYPMVFRCAREGEHILLQVSYDPQEATPVAVTMSNLFGLLPPVAILGTGERLHTDLPAEAATGEQDMCCYVLLHADRANQWRGTLTFEMSDGTAREVPYYFYVLSPEQNEADHSGPFYERTYAARQVGNTVTVTVEGSHGTTGCTATLVESPTNASPPEYNLVETCRTGPVGDAITPFSATAQFTSEEKVEFVRVHDLYGHHDIPVQ